MGEDDRSTQRAYDAVAGDYARLVPDLSLEASLDRAVLTAFVELLGGPSGAPVVDVGCGTGRVTAHLADAGLLVVGLDLSPGMLAAARLRHPGLPLAVAHAAALPVRSSSLAGAVAWYSLIHLPPSTLPAVARELARAVRPGAPVLVAFQSGEGERVDRPSAYGRPVPLTSYRHRVEDMAGALAAAGFDPCVTLCREAVLAHETAPQAFLLVRRWAS